MFGIAFDLVVDHANALHLQGQRAAYTDIGRILRRHGFRRVQGSVYVSDHGDLARLTAAMFDLKAEPWFVGSVADIRAFRIEHFSDFTSFMAGSSK